MQQGKFELSMSDKTTVNSIVSKVEAARSHEERMLVISVDGLKNLLSDEEMALIDRVFSIDPKTYGLKTPYVGVEPVPDNLVRVNPQPYTDNGKKELTHTQFIPKPVHEAFTKMAKDLESEIGGKILIESGYRSSAYQAVVFLDILKDNGYNLQKTVKQVAIPGYSEHGTPSKLALDIQTTEGIPSEDPDKYMATPEYEWLVANAGKYGFVLSLPKDNPYGMLFEPWHWRYTPET
jgi:hypothetical protein